MNFPSENLIVNSQDPLSLSIWLWRHPQVGFEFLMAFGELLLDDRRICNGGEYDAFVPVFPINGRGHAVVVGQLQRVNHAQDLIEVSAGGRRVGHHKTHFFLGVNDENRPNG